MNENKFSPPLQRAGGGGGGVHDSEGGLPFKGAVPSSPLRVRQTGRTWGSGAQAGSVWGGDTNSGVCLPAHARTNTYTHAHERARTHERAHGPARCSARCPVALGPRHRKPDAGTSQEAPGPPGSNPISLLESTFRVEGSPKKDAWAKAPPLQETGRRPCLVVLRPPGPQTAPAPAARLPPILT